MARVKVIARKPETNDKEITKTADDRERERRLEQSRKRHDAERKHWASIYLR
jgi:hypothetical protein